MQHEMFATSDMPAVKPSNASGQSGGALRVKASASLACGNHSQMTDQTSACNFAELSMSLTQSLLFGKTFPEFSIRPTTRSDASLPRLSERIPPSFRHSNRDGGQVVVWLLDQKELPLGESLTVNISVFPNDASVCSLSQILLADVPSKYFLSAKACRGILRRAEKRGKALPEHLAHALKAVADSEQISTVRGGVVPTMSVNGDCHTGFRNADGIVPIHHSPDGAVSSKWAKGSGGPAGDECQNLVVGAQSAGAHPGAYNGQDAYTGHLLAHTLKAEGHDASEDGTGRGTPLVCGPITAGISKGPRGTEGVDSEWLVSTSCVGSQRSDAGAPKHEADEQKLITRPTQGVRRLLPIECERLQGFPDGWTDIPGSSDSSRYKQMGNAVTVNVAEWIARRAIKFLK